MHARAVATDAEPVTTGPAARSGQTVEVRLARHEVVLPGGRVAGLAVAGWGVPLVVINGFTAEGALYAQTASRLVSMGFKVIAIDTPGHGRSSPLPRAVGGIDFAASFIGDAMDAIGIGPCILLGHSTGGRIAAEIAADRADQVCGLILVDAIAGQAWDKRIHNAVAVPGFGIKMAVETIADFTLTTIRQPDLHQLSVLAKVVGASIGRTAWRPWRLLAPGGAIVTAPSSHETLLRLRALGVRTIVVHGDRDGLVPLAVGEDAFAAAGGPLVIVEDGGHLWCLQDPEVLPAIIGDLLRYELGDTYSDVVRRCGLDPNVATVAEIEVGAYAPGASVLDMTPPVQWRRGGPRRPPRHTWRVHTDPATLFDGTPP